MQCKKYTSTLLLRTFDKASKIDTSGFLSALLSKADCSNCLPWLKTLQLKKLLQYLKNWQRELFGQGEGEQNLVFMTKDQTTILGLTKIMKSYLAPNLAIYLAFYLIYHLAGCLAFYQAWKLFCYLFLAFMCLLYQDIVWIRIWHVWLMASTP